MCVGQVQTKAETVFVFVFVFVIVIVGVGMFMGGWRHRARGGEVRCQGTCTRLSLYIPPEVIGPTPLCMPSLDGAVIYQPLIA